MVEEADMTCHYIKTQAECETAATALGLADTSAKDGTKTSELGTDPPYCFFEGGHLNFDKAGTNTGACGNAWTGKPDSHDVCLCHKESKLDRIVCGRKSFFSFGQN